MSSSDPTKKKRVPDKGGTSYRRRKTRSKPGVKKTFSRDESPVEAGKKQSRVTVESAAVMALELPPGPVLVVHTPRTRGIVDTFLTNTSRVHTEFSALLAGSDGGYQGDIPGTVLARVEHGSCSTTIAILQGARWLIHAGNPESLKSVLDSIPADLAPARMEGEKLIVQQALKHRKFEERVPEKLLPCALLEASPRNASHGPGGHHRLARPADIPRLDEYAREFEKATGHPPPSDWENLIAKNRILLGMVEGTVASIAIRGPETHDRVLMQGVFTFKAFRRRGLARKLVAALAHQAAGRGRTSVAIVEIVNQPMLSLLDELQYNKMADYLIAVFDNNAKSPDQPVKS